MFPCDWQLPRPKEAPPFCEAGQCSLLRKLCLLFSSLQCLRLPTRLRTFHAAEKSARDSEPPLRPYVSCLADPAGLGNAPPFEKPRAGFGRGAGEGLRIADSKQRCRI
uniref:Uncharacterized protein n=1 Tax=Sphaerodactylus townsendi TaxID=933632 RepID=A0ACB8G798_9SAUR